MGSVLVIGRIRAARRAEADALLAEERPGARVYRQGDTVALLVDGPRAETRFLRLLAHRESALAQIVDCLDDVPLIPPEVTPTAGAG